MWVMIYAYTCVYIEEVPLVWVMIYAYTCVYIEEVPLVWVMLYIEEGLWCVKCTSI